MDEFKSYRLYIIGEHYKEFELWFRNKFADVPDLEKLDIFLEKVESFRETLEQEEWEESEIWVRNELKRITQVVDSFERQYNVFVTSLRNQLVSEINLLPIVLLPELPSRISRSSLEDVSEMFEEDIYDSLPAIARRDFQEATDCYLHGQATAAVVLALRATEATLREYYCRVLGKEHVNGAWDSLVNQLGNITPKNLLNKLKDQKDKRNEFAHPQRIAQPEYALRQIEDAISLSSEMVQNWRAAKKSLSIGLPHINSLVDFFEITVDLSMACFVLDKSCNGVGKITYFSEENYDPGNYDYILGMENGNFNRESTCISQELARHIGVTDKYNLLISFVESLRKSPDISIVSSDMPEQTLQSLLYAFSETSTDIGQFSLDSHGLFEIIQIRSLDPFDKYFAHDLPDQYSSLVSKLRQEVEEIESAWKKKLHINYGGAETIVMEAKKSRFMKLKKRAFGAGFELVILNDNIRSNSISLYIKKGSRINLQRLQKPFVEKTLKEFTCTTSKLESKDKVSITTKQIKEILAISEMPEVRENVSDLAKMIEQKMKNQEKP